MGTCSRTLAPMPLLLLLVAWLSPAPGAAQAESGTFNVTNTVVCRLNESPPGSADRVASFEVEFRTSHADHSILLGLSNADEESLTIVLASEDRIVARLASLTGGGSNSSVGVAAAFELATVNVTMDAPGVGGGDWHRLGVRLGNGSGNNASVHLDGRQLGDLTAAAQFVWGNASTQATVGGGAGFRGCLANASLDGAVQLPLHSQSSLINRTDGFITVDLTASRLPSGGSGCRQDPCPCLHNGTCVYLRWNVFQECNCTRGYEGRLCQNEWDTCLHLEAGQVCLNGGSCDNLPGTEAYKCNCTRGYEGNLCQNEWDTCLHLEADQVCLNGGRCDNRPGTEAYKCNCTPADSYLGSRCQSFNHCRSPITCQNGGSCNLTGDPETPSGLDYQCTCINGFSGRNCTEALATPPPPRDDTGLIVGISIGLIALLLIVIASLVGVKVVRDRRRDSGAYNPSQRETSANSVYADQDTMGMSAVVRPPQEERFI